MNLKFIESFLKLFCFFVHIRLEKINWCGLWNFYLFEKKVNKSNTNVSTHYWSICLYPENNCGNIFVTYKLFNFFFNSVNAKLYENISKYITIYIQSYPITSIDWSLSRYIKYGPSFNLGKLFLKLFLEFH